MLLVAGCYERFVFGYQWDADKVGGFVRGKCALEGWMFGVFSRAAKSLGGEPLEEGVFFSIGRTTLRAYAK